MKNLFLVLAAVFIFNYSQAEDEGAWHKGACKEDAKKFCPDVKPGGGRIIRCMKEHEKELSEGCKASSGARREAFKEARAEHKAEIRKSNEEIKDACKEDVKKLCEGVEPGRGRIMRCLKDKEAQVSEACKKEISERKEIHKEVAEEARKKRNQFLEGLVHLACTKK